MNEIEKSWKATNLKVGAIYTHRGTFEPMRLLNIIPCEGVWMETFDGRGYGETIKFEDVMYATKDEVEDYLEDLRAYTDSTLIKA